MAKKYQIQDESPLYLQQPSAVHQRSEATAKANDWNPNVPFTGTQEEWWEHFQAIERGEFKSLGKANAAFEEWKKEFLANQL